MVEQGGGRMTDGLSEAYEGYGAFEGVDNA